MYTESLRFSAFGRNNTYWHDGLEDGSACTDSNYDAGPICR